MSSPTITYTDGEITNTSMPPAKEIPTDLEVSTAARSSASRSEWAQQITSRWQDSVSAILDVGKLLIGAKKELARGEFSRMVDYDLPFSDRTAQRLIQIARHTALGDATHVSHLPAAWGTLYELSRIPPKQVRDLISNGEIHPDITREGAVALVPADRKRGARSATTVPREGLERELGILGRAQAEHVADDPHEDDVDAGGLTVIEGGLAEDVERDDRTPCRETIADRVAARDQAARQSATIVEAIEMLSTSEVDASAFVAALASWQRDDVGAHLRTALAYLRELDSIYAAKQESDGDG